MAPIILVIDDSEIITRMLDLQLSTAGFEVLVAHDGPSGIKLAEDYEPDVILLDVMMPEMDGYETCRRLRQLPSLQDTHVMMVTGLTNLADMQAGYEAGADDYIGKPFNISELKLKISAALRRSPANHTQNQVISVFSLRGGTGCTSLAVNLSAGLAQMWGNRMALIDLALPVGVCDMMLNIKPAHNLSTLADYDANTLDIELIRGCIMPHETGVHLLGGIVAAHKAELVTDRLVSYLIESLKDTYRYIVLDTAHHFSPPILAALDQSDLIVMPITPDINSVRLGISALKVFDAIGYPEDKVKVIVNWTFSDAGISAHRIRDIMKHPVDLVIPYVPALWSEAINQGIPVIVKEPEHPLASMLEDLVWQVSLSADVRQKQVKPSKMWSRTVARMASIK